MPAFASIEARHVAARPGPGRRSASTATSPTGPPSTSSCPNVRVLGDPVPRGADPGVARFRYVFDPADPPTDPTSFQQALSVDSDLPGVVQNDDRLVVLTFNPDGSPLALFDGFAQVPELGLSPVARAGHVPGLRRRRPRVGHARSAAP